MPSASAQLLDGGGRDARGADAVAAHDDRLLLARLVEVRGAQRLGVLGPELEDVADLDHLLDRRAARRTAGRPRRPPTVCRSAKRRLEVAPRRDAAQVEALAVGAHHVARPRCRCLVGEDRHPRAHGPDRADRRAEHAARSRPAGRARKSSPDRPRELALVQGVVAAHERPAPAPPAAMVEQRLDREPRIDLQERARPRRWCGRPGVATSSRVPGGKRGGGRHPARELDVGRVAARRAERDLVLAGRARRHELVGAEAAHHAGVGVHDVEARARSARRSSGRRASCAA